MEKLKEMFGSVISSNIIKIPLIILGVLICVVVYNNLPSDTSTKPVLVTGQSEVKEEKVSFKLVDPMDYPYGEVIKDILDYHNISYYEPAVNNISYALSRYMVRDIATRYRINKEELNITEDEYRWYYSMNDTGRIYRNDLANKLIDVIDDSN
jgi:hypothetical protein